MWRKNKILKEKKLSKTIKLDNEDLKVEDYKQIMKKYGFNWVGFNNGSNSEGDLDLSNLQKARKFVSKYKKIKHCNKGSYRLKHIFEKSKNGCYINNGFLILACLLEGFSVKKDGINGLINIEKGILIKGEDY